MAVINNSRVAAAVKILCRIFDRAISTTGAVILPRQIGQSGQLMPEPLARTIPPSTKVRNMVRAVARARYLNLPDVRAESEEGVEVIC